MFRDKGLGIWVLGLGCRGWGLGFLTVGVLRGPGHVGFVGMRLITPLIIPLNGLIGVTPIISRVIIPVISRLYDSSLNPYPEHCVCCETMPGLSCTFADLVLARGVRSLDLRCTV